MSNVTRLPKQHKRQPHCPTCESALPTLDSVQVTSSACEFGDCELMAITYHVRCKCGSPWDLRKKIAGAPLPVGTAEDK
jgi:hypothetical protein